MATIGIFDSGVGGLSVFREIRKVLPDEKYVYFADNAYCPYGEKEPEQILDRAREISDFLLYKGADIIVVACNTATAAAIAALREEYSKPNPRVNALTQGRIDHIRFIGMEPAVKPAALHTRSGVIGVLATAGTLSADKYLNTKGQYENDVRIIEHVGDGFVELVERGIVNGPEAESVVRASVQPLLDEGADHIVLGCTHYPFLQDTIRAIAGPDVKIIDPAPAVAQQLLKVMEEEGIKKAAPQSGLPENVCLCASGAKDVLFRIYSSLA